MNARRWLLLVAAGLVLLLAAPRPVWAPPAASVAGQISAHQQEMQRQQTQIAQLEREVADLIRQGNDVAALIQRFQRDIDTVQAKLAQTTVQLNRLTADKNAAERKLTEETRKLNERQRLLGRRVREIYKRGGSAAYWQVLFTAKDFGDLIRRFHFLKLVMAQDATLIRELRTERLRLDGNKRQLEAQVAEIAAVKKQEDEEKRKLDAAKLKLEIARRGIQQNRTTREAAIRKLKDDVQRLANLIDILRSQLPPTGGRVVDPVPGGNFPWPLRGAGRAQVIRDFGSYTHPEYGVRVSNNGIDIAAPAGSPVLAIAAGTVMSVTEERGYGKVMVINHGNGLLAMYAYLASLAAGKDARVTAGQVIGTVGMRPEDGKPALHLETHGNEPQNPLRWLVNR